jgi:hypothetical protein
MLLGGGSSCQQCGCVGDPCPECRHYTVDTWYLTATMTVTINGVNIPVWNGTGAPPAAVKFTPSGAVQSTCFSVGTSPKQIGFRASYYPDVENVETPCLNFRTYGTISAFIDDPNIIYSTMTTYPKYVLGACSDTGGVAGIYMRYNDTTQYSSAAWTNPEAIYLYENCEINYRDWLAALTVVTTFAWDACVCPP